MSLKRFTSVSVFILSLTAFTFLFQNCAEPLGVDEGSDASLSQYSGAPFAYDYKPDHIAYMSCSGASSSANPQAQFSFKVGSFGFNRGLSLRQSFLNNYSNLTSLQKVNALLESPENSGAQVQLALRQKGNLHSYYSFNSLDEGEDFDNMAVPLANEKIAERLVAVNNSTLYTKYFSRASEEAGVSFPGSQGGSGNHMFGQLNFSSNESLAENVRVGLNNQTLAITTTFANVEGDNPMRALSPSIEDHKYAYGRQFDVNFSIGHGIPSSGVNPNPQTFQNFNTTPTRVLATVTERNLETLSTEGQWICPSQLKFMIVRPEDNADRVLCGYDSVPGSSGITNQKQLLETRGYTQEAPDGPPPGVVSDHYFATRNILPLEHWHVDFARRCVVPKKTQDQCYGTSINFDQKPVNYSAELGQNDPAGSCGNNTTCPHYVSICYKVQ